MKPFIYECELMYNVYIAQVSILIAEGRRERENKAFIYECKPTCMYMCIQ